MPMMKKIFLSLNLVHYIALKFEKKNNNYAKIKGVEIYKKFVASMSKYCKNFSLIRSIIFQICDILYVSCLLPRHESRFLSKFLKKSTRIQ